MPPTTVSPLYQLSYFSVAKYIYTLRYLYIYARIEHCWINTLFFRFSFFFFFFTSSSLQVRAMLFDRQTDTNKRANKETEKTTQPDTDVICM